MNRWLLYQTLAAALWARSGYYQPGGAFGFRDQLQDVMALGFARPDLRARAPAARGRAPVRRGRRPALVARARRAAGMRTRCSDDLLWLPYVGGALRRDHRRRGRARRAVPFLDGAAARARRARGLRAAARSSARAGTLYEHCLRAIDRGLTAGAHGLPLIGSGDWNDGMNRVGDEGRGESVWLGFFLHAVLTRVRAAVRGARRRARGPRATAPRRARLADDARAGLGRRVVPPRLLRRRHAARLGAERRVPDRLDRAVLGGALGRRAAPAGRARDGRGAHAPGAARRAG